MAIDDTRQKKESPYAPPAGRKETPEEKYERLENKNRQIRAKLDYERSEEGFRPARDKKIQEYFAPEQVDEEFDFEEPAVPQAGMTAEEEAEETESLDDFFASRRNKAARTAMSGKRGGATPTRAEKLRPMLDEAQLAMLDRDLAEATGPAATEEAAPPAAFTGAGGYSYSMNEAGDYEFTGPDGKTGVAKQGTRAFESIASEAAGKGSLYGTQGYAGPSAGGGSVRIAGDNVPSYGADTEDELAEILQGQGIDPTTVDIYETGEEAGSRFFSVPKGTSEEDVSAVGKIRADPEAQFEKGEAEAEEEEPREIGPAPKTRGDFSSDNPPPAFSPEKIAIFLDQNPQIAKDPEKLRDFIDNANYGNRQDAEGAFVDTIRAKRELGSLAQRAENLSFAEKERYAQLRQLFNVPATLSDRAVGAAQGALQAGTVGLLGGPLSIPAAVAGGIGGAIAPRTATALPERVFTGTPREIAAMSRGTTGRGEVGAEFEDLLEQEFESR
tara:strand:- start:3681 stop:5177 length:1497 start_codon:yes stop_codon:yes gene_type:complete